MVLIFRDYHECNRSYEEVIDWLIAKKTDIEFHFGKDFYNGNKEMNLEIVDDKEENSENRTENSIWFRGFLRHRIFSSKLFKDVESTNDNIGELRWRLGIEINKVNKRFFQKFDKYYQLPKISSISIDKFDTLELAKKTGLEIPRSLITNSKKALQNFQDKHSRIISKSLYETVYFKEDDQVFFYKTEIITQKMIDHSSDFFFPSFFQEYIDKDIELRVFFLNNDFYSMAIFSQLDEQTATDFRRYNELNPNRNVPYKLSDGIECKLRSLMQKLSLNTGSIDLIRTPDGRYVFLEVNPTGQFGFVSKPCNYYLEPEFD